MKEIAFFDFDGTITKRDSLFVFIKHAFGKAKLCLGILALSPWLILHKANLLSSKKTKERVLKFFFEGMNNIQFTEICNSFSTVIDTIVRPQALQKIRDYQQKGILVVIVSASIENWIIPWAKKNQIDVVATRLEFMNEKITGRILGENCNGYEKVLRIKAHYDLNYYQPIATYGDSKGDLPMLALAPEKHMKPFR